MEMVKDQLISIRSQLKKIITKKDKLKLYEGMLITRETDNALKRLFLSGEITYLGKSFQGKGFRSLGQEAIYGAPFFLKPEDICGPMIRDLGVFLAMSKNDVETAINAQAGKSGKPCDGRDLHLGDLDHGLLTPAAPLAISTCTLIGMALSFKLNKESRVAVSFIGEGGTSLGEWHEAINFAAVQRLPMIFCIENNKTALSTPIKQQSRLKSFAIKAYGYGIDSLLIDGNDIEEVALAFGFAAIKAKKGKGPILIELDTMRMCGHAHHDDVLYLGKKDTKGYVDEKLYESFLDKDPIKTYESKLRAQGIIDQNYIEQTKVKVKQLVENAILAIKNRPWPKFTKEDDALVFKAPYAFAKNKKTPQKLKYASNGSTYLQAISKGMEQAFTKHHNCVMIGEDIAPPYGNAFMMFKELGKKFPHRFINTPISENAIVGSCVGLALEGFLPVAEMQFNDFIACAMNQVVNNVAKYFYRTNKNLPMVIRMPYGGMRRAGPYHSQDTSPWFYRTFGLKIMAPSTPIDAMSMLMAAILDPDPVLFYEHIALYRDPNIKEELTMVTDDVLGARVMNHGCDISIISYGAYTHKALRAIDRLAEQNIFADVIDLRYLAPLDLYTIYDSIKKTSRALLVGEDASHGGILESIAAKISHELFNYLDAPVKVLGARDIPVPYAPSLEDQYLLSEQEIIKEAIRLKDF